MKDSIKRKIIIALPVIVVLLVIITGIIIDRSRDIEPSQNLVIYTSMKEAMITALVDDFIKNHPDIPVEYRIDGAGSLMARIETERANGRIEADIIWTSEIPDFYYMKDEGLLLQYRPAGTDGIYDPLGNTAGHFLSARLGTMGIAYNTDMIETPPSSWRELSGPAYKDNFAIADPSTSGTAMMSAALLLEEFGEQFFRDLKANGAVVGAGSSQVVNAVAAGELAACLSVDYIAFDLIASGAPIGLAYPDEMLVIPSPLAIFKDSTDIEAAKAFADYMFTPEAQRIIAGIGTLPILEGVEMSGEFNIPPVAEALERAIIADHLKISGMKDDIIALFLSVMR